MQHMYILSQAFGIIALIIVCIGYFVKKKSTFLMFQIFADIFYSASFLFINVLGAGVITIISTIRCVVFYFIDKKNPKLSLYFVPMFFALYIATAIIFWTSWIDIVPIVTAMLFTIAYVVKSLNLTRYLVLLPNFALMVFGIINANYATAILDFIEFSVVIISIITCHIRDKKSKNN